MGKGGLECRAHVLHHQRHLGPRGLSLHAVRLDGPLRKHLALIGKSQRSGASLHFCILLRFVDEAPRETKGTLVDRHGVEHVGDVQNKVAELRLGAAFGHERLSSL